MPSIQFDSGKPERLAVLALVVIGLVAYVDCLASEFVFDDVQYINAYTFGPSSLEWLLPRTESPIRGRPLVGLSLFLNFLVGGTKPAGYHLFNLAVHLSCATILMAVIRRAVMLLWQPRSNESEATAIAFCASLLWMIHPLQTECVNYVSQRTESMASLFILASLYCAIRTYDTVGRQRWIVLAGVCCWAGAFCKETAALAPLLIVLFDVSFSRGNIVATLRQRWVLYATTFSGWIAVVGMLTLAPRSTTVGASGSVTVLQYAMNQCVLLVQYLRLVAWPDALVIDYGHPQDVPLVEVIPAAIAVLSLLLLTLTVYRRLPAIGYLGLSAFLLLAPTSSIIPINSEVGAERRMYLPLAAVSVLVVLAARQVIRLVTLWVRRHDLRWGSVRLQPAMCSVLLIATTFPLGIRTAQRTRDYANPLKLWTEAVIAHPDNSRAWSWLATEFLRVDPSTAERVTGEMANRWSDDVRVSFLAGDHFLGFHDNREKATECFRRVLELEPDHTKAKLRLVWLLSASVEEEVRNGNEALRFAQELNEKYPGESELLDALAMAHAECGDFAAATKTAEEAVHLAEANGGQAALIAFRLEGYRQKEPFRLGVAEQATN